MKNELTEQEINEICSKYLGRSIAIPINLEDMSEEQRKTYLPFTNDINYLIPIWEKFNTEHRKKVHFEIDNFVPSEWCVSVPRKFGDFDMSITTKNVSLQYAFAEITALAILELGGGR